MGLQFNAHVLRQIVREPFGKTQMTSNNKMIIAQEYLWCFILPLMYFDSVMTIL